MSGTKRIVIIAIAVQAGVILATLWILGAPSGAEIATRNTARTAAIFFAWAVALRPRPSEGPAAMYGFVAAHAMHFASVGYFSIIYAAAPLHVLNAKTFLSMAAGSTLLGALALTIGSHRGWSMRINRLAVFIFGFVFTAATVINGIGFRHGRLYGSVVPLPFLLAAFFVRIRDRKPQLARAASAS